MLRLTSTSTLFPYTTLFRSFRAVGRIMYPDGEHAGREGVEHDAEFREHEIEKEDLDEQRRRADQLDKHRDGPACPGHGDRSEEHTSELQSRLHLVCRLLLEK